MVRSLLLIEDNPLTRKLVRAAIATDDCTVLEATTGAAALTLLDQHRPRLILVDLLLPDQSGYELVHKLRAHRSVGGVPILAFTGLVGKSDEARISNAGFDGLVTKPIDVNHLRAVVRAHLAEPDRERRFGLGKRLLIVDDDPQQLKVARFRLSNLGFTVDTAVDGHDALTQARAQPPDAILTDVLMPRLDGFGLCIELRSDPTLAQTPVVMATSSYVENDDRLLAERAGANALVLRTPDLADVIRTLDEVLTRAGTSPAPSNDDHTKDKLDTVRAQRTVRQLERQVALNSGLLQRCAMLSAELSVLSTVADALVKASNIDTALFDILATCLDVVGASRGAIFSNRPDGSLAIETAHGFADSSELLPLIAPHDVRSAVATAEGLIGAQTLFGAALGDGSIVRETAIVIPLRAHGQMLGAMLIDTPATVAISDEDWRAFAHAISSQVSLALALAASFSRVEASEHRARALMDSAGDGIFVSRDDGRVIEVNRAGEKMVGRSINQIIGAPLETLIAGDRAMRPTGLPIPVEASSSSVVVNGETMRLTIVRDVSERNALADQLRQAQKMEAIGRLAGGVAHDFNNLLSVVLSYSYLLLSGRVPSDPVAEDVSEIKKAGERAAELTRQLLAFSRHQVLQPRVVALNDIVQSSERMLRRLIGEDISLTLSLGNEVGNVYADVGQLHQVLLNLVVNSRDAMDPGGKIVIGTSMVTLYEPSATIGLGEGRYALLTVSDSGHGMDEATRARVFEPFFTTKEPGKGTGLGLATVFGIVDQTKGRILVESTPGKGTTFLVYLPATEQAQQSPNSAEPSSDVVGTETVLVVEDEDQIRAIICTILRRAGYLVLEAPSPGEALLVAEQSDEPIDLLLTDMVMPRMNGVQLAERMTKTQPTMKVLLMSGYADDAIAARGLQTDNLPYLQKPIRPQTLLRGVRDAIDGVSST